MSCRAGCHDLCSSVTLMIILFGARCGAQGDAWSSSLIHSAGAGCCCAALCCAVPQIPTGEVLPVAGTVFDFCSEAHTVGERLQQVSLTECCHMRNGVAAWNMLGTEVQTRLSAGESLTQSTGSKAFSRAFSKTSRKRWCCVLLSCRCQAGRATTTTMCCLGWAHKPSTSHATRQLHQRESRLWWRGRALLRQ
jgi:hypothetical protein